MVSQVGDAHGFSHVEHKGGLMPLFHPRPHGRGLDHQLVARTSEGGTRTLPLAPRSVAEFYDAYMAMLRSLGVLPRIRPVPGRAMLPLTAGSSAIARTTLPPVGWR